MFGVSIVYCVLLYAYCNIDEYIGFNIKCVVLSMCNTFVNGICRMNRYPS